MRTVRKGFAGNDDTVSKGSTPPGVVVAAGDEPRLKRNEHPGTVEKPLKHLNRRPPGDRG